MTKEEKKEHREVKRRLRAAVLAKHFKDFKYGATSNQLKQEAKRVADQLLAGRVPSDPIKIVRTPNGL